MRISSSKDIRSTKCLLLLGLLGSAGIIAVITRKTLVPVSKPTMNHASFEGEYQNQDTEEAEKELSLLEHELETKGLEELIEETNRDPTKGLQFDEELLQEIKEEEEAERQVDQEKAENRAAERRVHYGGIQKEHKGAEITLIYTFKGKDLKIMKVDEDRKIEYWMRDNGFYKEEDLYPPVQWSCLFMGQFCTSKKCNYKMVYYKIKDPQYESRITPLQSWVDKKRSFKDFVTGYNFAKIDKKIISKISSVGGRMLFLDFEKKTEKKTVKQEDACRSAPWNPPTGFQ